MLPLLAIESLVRGFRNLVSVESAGPRFNVVSGDNGQGKTNLLEAVYVVATSQKLPYLKAGPSSSRWAATTASVRARIREGGQAREQVVGICAAARASVRVDGKRSPTLAGYAVRTPAVVFHPGSLAAVDGIWQRAAAPDGPARPLPVAREPRRRGRVRQGHAGAVSACSRHAARASRDLDDWEELVVRHGGAERSPRGAVAVAGARAPSAPSRASARRAWRCKSPTSAAPRPRPEAFRQLLVDNRTRDRARGSATVGPHRDDVLLELAGRAARGHRVARPAPRDRPCPRAGRD